MFNFLRKIRISEAELWIQAAQRRSEHTPDMDRLTDKTKHLLLVYDDMKLGFPSQDKLIGDYIGPAISKWDNYVMWNKHYKDCSAVAADAVKLDPKDKMKYPGTPTPGRIKGQLYLVPTENCFQLDEIMANGIYSVRKRISVELPWSDKRYIKLGNKGWVQADVPSYVRAWMYVSPLDAIKDELHDTRVKPGRLFWSPTRRFNQRNFSDMPYYEFTKLDLNGK